MFLFFKNSIISFSSFLSLLSSLRENGDNDNRYKIKNAKSYCKNSCVFAELLFLCLRLALREEGISRSRDGARELLILTGLQKHTSGERYCQNHKYNTECDFHTTHLQNNLINCPSMRAK